MGSTTNSESTKVFMVGYGTFITNKTYSEAQSIFLCKLKNYHRIWLKTTIYPFILPDPNYPGIHAICFTINKDQLPALDKYEGVEAGLYTRELIEVELLEGDFCKAFIYIPTKKCIDEFGLNFEKDPNDEWMEEIRKNPEIKKKFPQLLQYL